MKEALDVDRSRSSAALHHHRLTALELRDAVQGRAQHQSAKFARRSPTRSHPGRARAGPGPVVSARLGRRLGRRSPACATRPGATSASPTKTLWPLEGELIVDQLLFDSGGREAEIRRQAARTDAAAARVEERSEFVALNVARTYIDYLLQQRLVAIARGQCDLPRAARRRSSRRRRQGLDQHRRPAAGRRAAAVGARPRDRGPRGSRHRGDRVPDA